MLLLIAIVYFVLNGPVALALSQADRDAIYRDSVWYKNNSVKACGCIDAPQTNTSTQTVDPEAAISAFIKENGGSSVYFQEVGNDKSTVEKRADVSQPTASLYKLFSAQVLYQRELNGNINLSSTTTISKLNIDTQKKENVLDGVPDSAVLPWESSPTVTYDACIAAMLRYSDNVCGAWLKNIAEPFSPAILKSAGYNNTDLINSKSTAADVGKLLTNIANEKFVSKAASQEVYSILLQQYFRKKIPAGVPSSGEVANKTGELHQSNYSHDAAIVKLNGKTYVLVVMTNMDPDVPETAEKIAKLSSDIFGGAVTSGGGGNCSTAASQSNSVSVTGLSVKDKIAQLLMVDASASTATNLAKKYNIGGFYGNGGNATSLYTASAIQQVKQAGSVPALIGIDEEGGKVDRLSGNYPSAKAMGGMPDAQVQGYGSQIGKALNSMGVDVDFAPVADLDSGKNKAISGLQRAFSNSPNVVAQKAGAFAKGLQSAGITPTFKHFPGLGNAVPVANSNGDGYPATTPPLSQMERNDLVPYESLLKTSGSAVMIGNQFVPGLTGNTPASQSSATYNLLRDKYGFNGVAFTDSLPGSPGGSLADKTISAIQAGADMALLGAASDQQISDIMSAINTAVTNGKLSQERIDQSVAKIMQLKGTSVSSPPTGAQPSSASGSSIFFLGDSLTVGMSGPGQLKKKAEAAGFSVTGIEAKAGRSTSASITPLNNNSSSVAAAKMVVVALGTNDGTTTGESSYTAEIKKMISSIKTINQNAQIYWVNAYADDNKADYSGVNKAIANQAGPLGYTVIDWYKEASTNNSKYTPFAGIPGPPLVHPDQHYPEMADFIISSLSGTATSGGEPNASGIASCVCTTSGLTTLSGNNNEQKVENFIRGLNIDGKTLTTAQLAGVMGNLSVESGFDPTVFNKAGSGAYGLAQWIDGRLDNLKTWSGNQKPPMDYTTLEAQLGFLEYELRTNNNFAWDDLITTTTATAAATSWEDKYERSKGQLLQERKDRANEYYKKYTNGGGSAPASDGSCGDSAFAFVNTDGYAYPVAPLKQFKGGRPCPAYPTDPAAKCHGEPQYAFDFMRPGGTAVFAVVSGTIGRVNTAYSMSGPGIPGCMSLNLYGVDGWKYWYGHLQKVLVSEGKKVEAGQKIAEVADKSFGDRCWGGDTHVHLDRGYPKGQPGGGVPLSDTTGDQRRDPTFIPFIQKLYDELPS